MNAWLHVFGHFVPERVVGNAGIAARIGKTPEWIENASGIRERRWARRETSGADLGVAAAEKMSALLEAHSLDSNTAMLFGDGAGAVLISSRQGRWRLLDAALHSAGEFRADLAYDAAGGLRMNGLFVILHASRKLPAAIEEALARQNMTAAEVRAFLLHQANRNLLDRVAKALGVEQNRIFTNLERYGNTSSASMLIAASEWAAAEPPSGPAVFAAFGAGFHWGAVVATSETA